MTELLTAAQMRATEEAAIAAGAATGLELMERAGQGVVDAVLEAWPELRHGARRAVVLCGPGNNGGDGFVVARLLRGLGWGVRVFLHGAPDRLPPDARVNRDRWIDMAGPVAGLASASAADGEGADLVVDALFGTGLTRPLSGDLRVVGAVAAACSATATGKVVAIDAPSGLCLDSGRPLRHAADARTDVPFADLTVTFHARKLGHVLDKGPVHCGTVRVVDIGLRTARDAGGTGHWPAEIVESVGLSEAVVRGLGKPALAHKYAHGLAFVLSGPAGRGGAARLAARGALRIGAGLVTVGCPPDALLEHAARLDAVMLRCVADAEALTETVEDVRIAALCLGPALGTGAGEAALVAAALKAMRATVLDADALTLLSREAGLTAALHGGCVLTPHAGEFARLFPDIAAKLDAVPTKGPAYSKVDAAREAAARAGCVVLFKGADTVIAAPDGRCAINSAHGDRAAPWLATAGAGDVLTGFIAGLLARGFRPFDAACTGAWLHVGCAREFGPGLIAEDLPEMLPAVFRRLGV